MIHQNPDDAFAIAPEDQVVFHVLSGAQQGAEMTLQQASYVIGSSEDADIVLPDGSLKPNHGFISIGLDGVTFKSVDGPCVVGGAEISNGDSVLLDLPSVIVMGNLAVAIGENGTDWAALPVSDSPEPEPVEDPQPDTGSEDPPAEIDAAPEVSDVAAPAPSEPVATTTAEPPKRSRWKYRVGILTVALVTALGLYEAEIGPIIAAQDTSAPPPVSSDVSAIEQVSKVVATLGLDGLTVTADADGGATISGFLDTVDERDALSAALDKTGVAVTTRIRVAEQLQASIRTTLAALTWPEPNFADHLKVRSNGDGQFVIDGYLGPEVDKSALHRRLQSDVPGITGLRFERSELRGWQTDLEQRIAKAGLSDWLRVTHNGAMLRVEGELTAKQALTWRQVGDGFAADSGGYPRVSIGVRAQQPPAREPEPEPVVQAPAPSAPQAPEPARPDILVSGIVISERSGKVAYLSDGKTLYEGDRLDNGAVVLAIEATHVVIELGDQLYDFHIGERR